MESIAHFKRAKSAACTYNQLAPPCLAERKGKDVDLPPPYPSLSSPPLYILYSIIAMTPQ